MWILTQPRKNDNKRFLLDLATLGMVFIDYPTKSMPSISGYRIEAGSPNNTWILASVETEEDAQNYLTYIYDALRNGENAIDMNVPPALYREGLRQKAIRKITAR